MPPYYTNSRTRKRDNPSAPRLRLRENILKAITRMQTLPPEHPLYKYIHKTHRSRSWEAPFPSNLENIAKSPPDTRKLETIHPYIRPPWWSLRANIRIDENKEVADNRSSDDAHHPGNSPD